jgi:chromosomal replication initiation ATPase DnaA
MKFSSPAAHRRNEAKAAPECDLETLAAVVGEMFEVSKDDLCSRGKSSRLVFAKEVLILSGRRLGASLAEISDLIGLNPSTVSRRCDAAKLRSSTDPRVPKAVGRVIKEYAAREQGRIAILQV